MNPVLRFGENLHAADAGLLVKFAVCGGLGVLVRVDAALGHLPAVIVFLLDQLAYAPSKPNQPVRVKKHDAHARAVRKRTRIFQRHCVSFFLIAYMEDE